MISPSLGPPYSPSQEKAPKRRLNPKRTPRRISAKGRGVRRTCPLCDLAVLDLPRHLRQQHFVPGERAIEIAQKQREKSKSVKCTHHECLGKEKRRQFHTVPDVEVEISALPAKSPVASLFLLHDTDIKCLTETSGLASNTSLEPSLESALETLSETSLETAGPAKMFILIEDTDECTMDTFCLAPLSTLLETSQETSSQTLLETLQETPVQTVFENLTSSAEDETED